MSDNVITYREGAKPQRIYVFLVQSSNGHLYVNFWDGANWAWSDRGAPSGVKAEGIPGAITYLEAGKQRISAFVRGENGHQLALFWNGAQWDSVDLGTPSGTTVMYGSSPGVITYLDEAGKQRIYAFVSDLHSHLYVNFWDGVNWKWSDRGTPPGTTVFGSPGVITYLDEASKQRIYAFVKGANGHLYVHFWDGANWAWSDRGTPPGTTVGGALEVDRPGVITYLDEAGKQRIYAFVRGQDNHLYVNYWDGNNWHWAKQSPATGDGEFVEGEAKVVTYPEAGKQRIYAFIRSLDLRLLLNFWDGAHWGWRDQGAFFGNNYGPYGAITYRDQTDKQRIYAFCGASTGHLVVSFWDGAQWKTADQGEPL